MDNITIADAKLSSKIWIGEGFNLIEEIPNVYYEFSVILYSDKEEIESSDEEILSLPMKTGIFSFLNDDEENIYSESDGTPLQ
jgi:hypothetical protein